MLLKIKEIIQDNNPECEILLRTTFIELLILLNKAYDNIKTLIPNEEIIDHRISEIIDYISKNLTNKITLQELSEQFHLNIYYLSHMFKLATGFSIFEYIQFKRITLAKELLKSGFSPTTTALSTGFNDYPGFFRTFKKITGTNPRDYAFKK